MNEKEEKVIKAAQEAFLKYGYIKVTMNDIARAAGMSRPALYLVFPGKEEIFNAVILNLARELSEEVAAKTSSVTDPLEKLKLALEIWVVQLFSMINRSPESRELYESKHSFAESCVKKGSEIFEKDLENVLSLFPPGQFNGDVSPGELAHILSSTVTGFKQNSKTADELRKKIDLFLKVCLKG